MASHATELVYDERDKSGWSASQYNANASFVYSNSYTAPILELLSPVPGEKIIDFGCGSGELTLKLVELVQASAGSKGIVIGVDGSESMIEKSKANGVVKAFVSDIQDLRIPEGFLGENLKFDAVFSNATLHWCKRDPRGVLESAKRVLKNGGRLVVEMGGFMNCIGIKQALYQVVRRRGYDPMELDPWYFPSVEEYSKLLVDSSFEVIHASLNPRLTPLPTGLFAWLQLFARSSFLQVIKDDQEADDILREVEKMCEVDCKDKTTGTWSLMYVRLRIKAVLRL